MAGLTSTGFEPLTFEEIKDNIETDLELYNPGFDFSPESPDGQLINIMAVLISQAWVELNNVYNSYNPNTASGQALKNLGLITGIHKGSTTRSQATIDLIGTGNTLVPKGSIFADDLGNEFYTNRDAYVPTTVTVLAVVSGPIVVPAGTITTVVSQISGLTGVTQTLDGVQGSQPESELQYRSRRNRTVMRGSESVTESMSASLIDLGIDQVTVYNNDTEIALPDGTPAHNIHVVVGEFTGITDEEIGLAIFDNKGLGVPTYGSTSVVVQDYHDNDHTVYFTKAVEVPIFFNIDVTYHTTEIAGVEEAIKADLKTYIDSLLAGEDVIWSRLFGLITQHGESEVNVLEIGKTALTYPGNVVISETEYTSLDVNNIVFTIT